MSTPRASIARPGTAPAKWAQRAVQRAQGAPLRYGLRLAAAGLLVATAAIHLDLYLTGYRTIPTIGWLFLLQVIAGFLLAAAFLATGSWLVAAAGAGFALCTLGGYLLSVQVGLFGFREVRTTAGVVAGLIEVAAFGVLASLAVLELVGGSSAVSAGGAHAARSGLPGGVRGAGLGIACASAVVLALLGGVLANAGRTPSGTGGAGTGSILRTENVGGTVVLANARGLTLYWFAPDTPARSTCYGSCAQYWPPVAGPDRAAGGVTGTLGTIRRLGGALQETYDGHPLYTYIGDTRPGEANGNGLNLNGGLWHEVVLSS